MYLIQDGFYGQIHFCLIKIYVVIIDKEKEIHTLHIHCTHSFEMIMTSIIMGIGLTSNYIISCGVVMVKSEVWKLTL